MPWGRLESAAVGQGMGQCEQSEGFLKQAKVLYGLLPAESSLAIIATRASAGCSMLPSVLGG